MNRVLAVSLLVAVAGCEFSPQGKGAIVGNSNPRASTASKMSRLVAASSCTDLGWQLKTQAIAQMDQRLDENLNTLLQSGGMCWLYAEDATNGTPVPGSAGGGNKASEYSTTNNQVAGVDEADFLKNDGEFIWLVADGAFQVVAAWPAESARVLSRTPIEGTPKKLFVKDHRAVVYSSLPGSVQPANDDPYSWWYSSSGSSEKECTYGYWCDFTGDGHPTKITVLDIGNPLAPQVIREMRMNGSLVGSRRIGDAVHSVVSFPAVQFPGVKYWPDTFSPCGGSFDPAALPRAFDELRRDNIRAILQADVTQFLPSISDSLSGAAALVDCRNFYVSQTQDGMQFLVLVSFDMSAAAPVNASVVVGKPGAVYASQESLYVAARHEQGGGAWFWGGGGPQQATTVHKFALLSSPPSSTYQGSGVVKGRILSQFSLDERDGYLRIATTSGYTPSPDVYSTVSVLQEQGGVLEVVGVVDQIAPTEDIRAVRFEGERGFIVTFKKTDPLFVLDLSDPLNPAIAGEVMIPGFSTYMHMMDDTHLLTIGYDAEDHGSFAYFQGVELQIFDVSDMAAPRLTHRTVIGTRGSTSEALTNHLAFNYFPPKGILAVPMVICENSNGGGSYGDMMAFSGLLVYDVSTQTGFSLRGGVAHQEPETEQTYRSACSNWWTDANSLVKRSVIMDDFVYSVTEEEIRVQSLLALGTDVAYVDLKP
jgi:hypothetical protein